MSHILTPHRHDYKVVRHPHTTVANRTITDSSLSFAARGLLIYMLSQKPGWHLTPRELEKNGLTKGKFKELKDELAAAGYITLPDQERGARGRFAKARILIRETRDMIIPDVSEVVEGTAKPPATDDTPTVDGKSVNGETANGAADDGGTDTIQIKEKNLQINNPDQINNQEVGTPETVLTADDDDLPTSLCRGYFRDYQTQHGAMPATIEAALMQQAQRLGAELTKEVIERGTPEKNPWWYLLVKLINEPTPTMPPHPLPGSVAPSPAARIETDTERTQREQYQAEQTRLHEMQQAQLRAWRESTGEQAYQDWQTAMTQLELQMDRASFDTWLRGGILLRIEHEVYIVGVRFQDSAHACQHRHYRLIRRVLSDVVGRDVELCFEVFQPVPVVQSFVGVQ